MPAVLDGKALPELGAIDREVPNDASIALLVDDGECQVLLAGDARPDALP